MHTNNNMEGPYWPWQVRLQPHPQPLDNFPERIQSVSPYIEDNTIFGFNIVETIISFLCQDDEFPWSHIRSLPAFFCSVPWVQKQQEQGVTHKAFLKSDGERLLTVQSSLKEVISTGRVLAIVLWLIYYRFSIWLSWLCAWHNCSEQKCIKSQPRERNFRWIMIPTFSSPSHHPELFLPAPVTHLPSSSHKHVC